MADKIKFYQGKDYTRLGGLLALSYGGYIPSLYLSSRFNSLSEYATHFGIISGMFLALRLPYVRQVPLAITRVFARVTAARKTSEPQQDILDDVEELRQKAGIGGKVKARIIEKGVVGSAYTFGGEIFIGRKLTEKMDRAELKSVIAHEMSHIRTKDISERYLTWPPFVDSVLCAVSGYIGFVQSLYSHDTHAIGAAAATAALSF